MTRKNVEEMMGRLRMRHGIALRLIEALPENKLHEHPIPNMRTPAELVVHLYGMAIRELVEGVQRGEIRDVDEPTIVKGIRTNADLVTFARTSFDAASKAAATITDAQITANVKTPWGSNPPGAAMMEAINDEFYHHRGQLYAYARALGVTPPEVWDFENNAVEFQPAATSA
jgi:uncharacterized damage-inducible protein DinB